MLIFLRWPSHEKLGLGLNSELDPVNRGADLFPRQRHMANWQNSDRRMTHEQHKLNTEIWVLQSGSVFLMINIVCTCFQLSKHHQNNYTKKYSEYGGVEGAWR